jgi:hypothetical protein
MGGDKYGRLFTEGDVRVLLMMVYERGRADQGNAIDTVPHDGNRRGATLLADALAEDFNPTFPADEPLFLLRGQDQLATQTIDYYVGGAGVHGSPESHVEAAHQAAKAMGEWQAANPDRVKVPD